MNTYTVLKTQTASDFCLVEKNLPVCPTENLEQAPAHCLMHNLHLTPMQHVDENASVDEAIIVLERTHRRASFVVNRDEQLIGIISNARLGSRYILSIAAKRGCERKDLTVSDIMLPLHQVKQIPIKQLNKALVGDVLKTMIVDGCDYLLVTDEQGSQPIGYFDRIDTLKACGKAVNSLKPATNFSEIMGTVLHHAEI
ncbi:CBS domain-containing protein [Pseudoalteromonas sp. T1lg65]|uniref:CBS domain-containing protein n=1 Tax=Pseudoalteromonas sp. T1lg65 TaxID=2077101 RepID=UPI003F79F277